MFGLGQDATSIAQHGSPARPAAQAAFDGPQGVSLVG
jgi:hypothetical protein